VYEIEMNEMSEAFQDCWRAAGTHLNRQVDGGIQAWLRAHPYPPFLEHLSFRLGNQLFFVRIEDVDGRVTGPGNPNGVVTAAAAANGHACILPMTRRLVGDAWVPAEPGWGLLDATSRRRIDPVALVTAEDIEMTPWELHDMAVQIVRDYRRPMAVPGPGQSRQRQSAPAHVVEQRRQLYYGVRGWCGYSDSTHFFDR